MAWKKLGNEARRSAQRMAPDEVGPGKGMTSTSSPVGKPERKNSISGGEDPQDRPESATLADSPVRRSQQPVARQDGNGRLPVAGPRLSGRLLH